MIKSGGTIKDMVFQRPPNLDPLDSYMASESYMPEDMTGPDKEDEKVPVTTGDREEG